ncbi:class I SAM-dependent methyltransferase [Kibdelosporangium philippinense]|uniref:Class I SAM-dependent methyltransferase n=1 Tax=Kibdelosporangium philippinense TaxID=211113 RepID=A0ABS8ZG81_9PSEU|nr:class I SAM-dependent methyltransferase [Kibdelosporangium philippinense]MCE7006294.1 class I SAM-dependent methyltransferase [Kibdelosporangium philippinense]
MTDFQPEDFDFEAAYLHGDMDALPWVIGRPQPLVVALAAQMTGSVLDVGCGTGDNAIYLAQQGLSVTGIDASASAISMAASRAHDAGVSVRFEVGDATELAGYEGAFDTIVDSALYHCLMPGQKVAYVSALHRAARPGARLHLICFADTLPPAFPESFRVYEHDLRAIVGAKWTISRLERAFYTTSQHRDRLAQAVREMTERDDVTVADLGELPADENGNLLLPVWQLAATRNP